MEPEDKNAPLRLAPPAFAVLAATLACAAAVPAAFWFADVGWWWLAPTSRASRPPKLEAARCAFFAFMFFNGAVVFASGIGRVIGMAAVSAVLLAPFARRQRLLST